MERKRTVDLEELALRLKGLAHFIGSDKKSDRKYAARVQPFILDMLYQSQAGETECSPRMTKFALRYHGFLERMDYRAAEKLADDLLIKVAQ